MRFLLAETVVAFDHVRRTMTVTGERAGVDRAIDALGGPLGVPVAEPLEPGSAEAEMTEAGYVDAVERVKEHIAAGDAYQIVPSQRVRRRTGASPRPSTGRSGRSTPRRTCSCSTWRATS